MTVMEVCPRKTVRIREHLKESGWLIEQLSMLICEPLDSLKNQRELTHNNQGRKHIVRLNLNISSTAVQGRNNS